LVLPQKTEYKQCAAYAVIKSQLIKSYKRKDFVLMTKVLLAAPCKILGLKK
jgi:hypothetical protein